MRNENVSDVAGNDADDGWITGREALAILQWDNINSVRNRARMGGFRWRKLPNGTMRYWGPDVREYAAVRQQLGLPDLTSALSGDAGFSADAFDGAALAAAPSS